MVDDHRLQLVTGQWHPERGHPGLKISRVRVTGAGQVREQLVVRGQQLRLDRPRPVRPSTSLAKASAVAVRSART